MFNKIDGQGRVRFNSLVLFLAVITLALLSGFLVYDFQVSGKNQALIAKQNDVVHRVGSMMLQELGELEDFIRMLSINGVVVQSLAKDRPIDKLAMQLEFSKLGEHINNLLQIRWLDESGQEQVRVDVEAGRSFIVNEAELQFKGDRYYFTEGMQVEPPYVYLTPIDLNVEHGQIVLPYEPTVRITKKTGENDGLRKGLLIINYNLGAVFEQITQLSTDEARIEIINEKGFWLVNPVVEMCWGEELKKPKMNFSKRSPDLWQTILSSDYILGEQLDSSLISFIREDLTNSGTVLPEQKINILVSSNPSIVANLEKQAYTPALCVTGLIIVLGLGFIVRDYFSRMAILQLTKTLGNDRDSLALLNNRLDADIRQINLLKDDLAESKRLSSLGMMVAGVSHEMNTPIGGAMLTVSELKQQQRLLQQSIQNGLTKRALDEFIERLQSGIDLTERNLVQANTIIQSFKRLTLSRVDDEFVNVRLSLLASDLIKGLTAIFKKANIRVINEISDDINIISQPGILSQVLQNILLNAVEHGFYELPHGQITLSYERNEQQHKIMISDDGVGIPESMIESIFDPFVTGNRGKQHSGLGLHLVYQWVTQCLYGEIQVEQLLPGTRFILVLPIDPIPFSQAR